MISHSTLERSSISWIQVFWLALPLIWGALRVWEPAPLRLPDTPEQLSEVSDAVYYDNLAFQLARGRGFRIDLTDPQWRERWSEAEQPVLDALSRYTGGGETTRRAPLYPLLLAGVYLLGRDSVFLAQALGVIGWAFGLAIFWHWVGKRLQKWWVGWGAVGCLAGYELPWKTASQLLPDALSTVLLTAVWWRLTVAAEEPSRRNWWWAGAAFGVALLSRGLLNGWLVLVIAALPILSISWRMSGQSWFFFAQRAGAWGLAVVVLTSPWWVRNVQSLSWRNPVGVAGQMGWTGGYSDVAWNNWGNYARQQVFNLEQTIERVANREQLELPQREFRMGQLSVARARLWIRGNLGRLPALSCLKVASHWGVTPWRGSGSVLAALGLLAGVWGLRYLPYPLNLWLAVTFLLSSLTTAVTWAHWGRCAVPLLPGLVVAQAAWVEVVIRRMRAVFVPRGR